MSPEKTASGIFFRCLTKRTRQTAASPHNRAGKSALRLRNPRRVSPIGRPGTRSGRGAERTCMRSLEMMGLIESMNLASLRPGPTSTPLTIVDRFSSPGKYLSKKSILEEDTSFQISDTNGMRRIPTGRRLRVHMGETSTKLGDHSMMASIMMANTDLQTTGDRTLLISQEPKALLS